MKTAIFSPGRFAIKILSRLVSFRLTSSKVSFTVRVTMTAPRRWRHQVSVLHIKHIMVKWRGVHHDGIRLSQYVHYLERSCYRTEDGGEWWDLYTCDVSSVLACLLKLQLAALWAHLISTVILADLQWSSCCVITRMQHLCIRNCIWWHVMGL